MYRYIIKRCLLIIPVILGVSFLIYVGMEMAAGDPILMLAGETATAEMLEALREQYGYDRSVFYRYGVYILNLFQGDLGMSISMGEPVWDLYITRLWPTVQLGLACVTVSMLVSIPLGVVSAVKNGSLIDNFSMVFALVGISMPNFWFGLLLIIAFSLKLGWLPSYGNTAGWLSLILPTLTWAPDLMASLTRTTRSSMIDVLRQDYLRTARSKGVPEKTVIRKHALKNALIPIITILGSQFAGVLGGAALTETIFAWPGVGRLMVDAINQRDVPLACGCIVLTSILSCLILLVVDILYAYVDPRIKAQYTRRKKKS